MAHELIDVSNERSWAVVDRTLFLHANQGETPLGLLAWVAVEEIFCTGVTGIKDAFEHRLSVIHAVLVADVLQRVERRLGEPLQVEFIVSHILCSQGGSIHHVTVVRALQALAAALALNLNECAEAMT